jgi:hypothetical protein
MMDLQEHELSERGLQVAYLTPEMFDHYWPELEQILDFEPELWNKVFTKQNIRDRVHSTEIQAWVVFNGQVIRLVFFTQRYVSPNGIATLQLFWMYGTGLKEVIYLLDDVVDKFAAMLECQRLEVCGRKGFERLLAPLGAEYQYTVYSRPVRAVKEH